MKPSKFGIATTTCGLTDFNPSLSASLILKPVRYQLEFSPIRMGKVNPEAGSRPVAVP